MVPSSLRRSAMTGARTPIAGISIGTGVDGVSGAGTDTSPSDYGQDWIVFAAANIYQHAREHRCAGWVWAELSGAQRSSGPLLPNRL
jgi:hypothetical protein